jgi:alkyl hydroperoxide reductase subunit AhpC
MSVDVGDKAPSFTLPADGGGEISLKDFEGKTVVLYFYPKDDTSGCTAGLAPSATRCPISPRWTRRSSASPGTR